MKKLFPVLLALLLLAGCAAPNTAGTKQYQATFLTLFDTVTTIVGYGESEQAFQEQANRLHDELLYYHQLFDIYREYPGMHNLKTVNDRAGVEPVTVDRAIIDLLLDCRELYFTTGNRVDVTLGSVLSLWHDARETAVNDPQNAALPSSEDLRQALEHTGFDKVMIDEEACTIRFSDPELRLDVGAIAKGWAVERVCRQYAAGLLVSVGGNVCATGPRPTDGSPWVVGIQNPDGGSDYLHTLYISVASVVTSGDYQRYFTLNGERYHHIIDPDTLYPASYWRAVSVISPDSGLADALSTALYTLPLSEGLAMAESMGVEAMWIHADGSRHYTPGFEAYIRT